MASAANSVAPHLASAATTQHAQASDRAPQGSALSTARQAAAGPSEDFFSLFCIAGGGGPPASPAAASGGGASASAPVASTVSDAEAARLFASVLSAFDSRNPTAGRQVAIESCCRSPEAAAAVLSRYLCSDMIDLCAAAPPRARTPRACSLPVLVCTSLMALAVFSTSYYAVRTLPMLLIINKLPNTSMWQ